MPWARELWAPMSHLLLRGQCWAESGCRLRPSCHHFFSFEAVVKQKGEHWALSSAAGIRDLSSTLVANKSSNICKGWKINECSTLRAQVCPRHPVMLTKSAMGWGLGRQTVQHWWSEKIQTRDRGDGLNPCCSHTAGKLTSRRMAERQAGTHGDSSGAEADGSCQWGNSSRICACSRGGTLWEVICSKRYAPALAGGVCTHPAAGGGFQQWHAVLVAHQHPMPCLTLSSLWA